MTEEVKKHQRSCSTCIWSKTKKEAEKTHPDITYNGFDSWAKVCTNLDSAEYKTHYANRWDSVEYKKGRVCHTKEGSMAVLSNNKNDYVEYQKGSVKLRLQNGKMTLTCNVQADFNSAEKRKVEQDLSDVFEVVTLASEKLPKNEVPSTVGVVI